MKKFMMIVEDDENLSRGIVFAFEKEGFEVVAVDSAATAIKTFNKHHVDIVILDLGLPDGDGIELCRNIRSISDVPVVMLTARDLETDEVQGLTAGADDYITKPFSLSVLKARVEAALRRRDLNEGHIIRAGVFTLDTRLCKLFCLEDEIPLSATEYRLVSYFISNAGQVLTKKQILAALWDTHGNYVDENTLPVNISRLRSKIEKDPRMPAVIKTIHGMGYVWVSNNN
ncbi:MAG: response regulator transcription factor [Defluviitaleaceae bacterium]|nr:response regulator transcription factor [Defluviitaleaceae bacterium]